MTKTRVSKVRTFSEERLQDSDEERISKAVQCNNCKCPRILLRLKRNRFTTMRICTNPACFTSVDIRQLPSWTQN